MLKEGDFVMGSTSEGMIHGMIEHIMAEGGILGTPGSEYSLVSMPPENPAMSVRIYKENDGSWKPTAYSIGMMYKDAEKIDMENHSMETESDKAYHKKDKDKMKKEYQGCGCPMCKELNVDCPDCPVCSSGEMKSDCCSNVNKKEHYEDIIDEREGGSEPSNKELYNRIVAEAKAKFEVYPSAVANAWVSQEYKKRGGTYKADEIDKQAPCWDGYVQRGMKPGKNGKPVPNCVPAAKADDLWEDDDTVEYDTDTVSKAEGYSPPAGARSAARKAIKFKEDGKAKGAGTSVGWTRAGQLARGETLSLSTVKRMYSYFSRHEVDKKGKDWANQANPSNGYIMWLAWGGDAGFSWSRGIVNREKDKALFADFGKDYTKVQRETHTI
jgi:hypothetical protein